MTNARRHSNLTIFRLLLRQAWSYLPHVGAIVLLSLLATPLALLTPLPLKIAVDGVLGSQPLPDFLDWLLPSNAKGSGSVIIILVASLVLAIALLSELVTHRELRRAQQAMLRAGVDLAEAMKARYECPSVSKS